MGWLSGWQYRKRFTPPRASSLLTDIDLVVPVVDDADIGAGSAYSDGRDWRLTAADGETLIQTMRIQAPAIAGGVANGLLRVVTPEVSAVVDSPCYLYYGRTGVSSVIGTTLSGANLPVWASDMETDSGDSWIDGPSGYTGYGGVGTADGKIGQGLQTDGTSAQYASAVTPQTPVVSVSVSVSAWVKFASVTSSPSDVQGVVTRVNSSGLNGWGINYLEGNWFYFFVDQNGGGNFRYAYANAACVPGVWYHVCGVFGEDGVIRLYVDGVLQSSTSTATQITYSSATTRIGIYPAGTVAGLNGVTDAVAQYDRALSPAEIAYHVAQVNTPGTWGSQETAPSSARPWLYRRSNRVISGGTL